MLVVSGHPLDRMDEKSLHVQESDGLRYLRSSLSIDALDLADYVVTDYSSVVFEAGLVGKNVVFYTPDIDEYRQSPGLNIDVEREMPGITFRDATQLGRYIDDAVHSAKPQSSEFQSFMTSYGSEYLLGGGESSCQRIVRLVRSLLDVSLMEGADSGWDS